MEGLIAVCLALTCAGGQDTGSWDATWDLVARATALEPGSAERAELEARLRDEHPTDDALRSELSERLLAGRVTPDVPGLARGPWPFDGRESWLWVQALPAGAARVRAVREGLAATPGVLGERELQAAWQTAVEEARAMRLDAAIGIQSDLHARYQADWTAMDLSLSLTLAGDTEQADAILASAIETRRAAGQPVAELWARRGILALGVGDERLARDCLGRGLARGSSNATLVLARLDLDGGRLEAARHGFRKLLEEDPPGAWALRGWGLSLVAGPRPPAPAGTRPSGR